STHSWKGSRVFSIVRQNVINALAEVAQRAGADIVTNLAAVGASPEGELFLANGTTCKADLVIAADGSNSRLRDGLGLLAKRKYLAAGGPRLPPHKRGAERASGEGKTIKFGPATRQFLSPPCREADIYIAWTMLDTDKIPKTVRVRKDAWKRWFPPLEALI